MSRGRRFAESTPPARGDNWRHGYAGWQRGDDMASKPRTHWERAAEQKREKLEQMQQQIAAGTLTVRQMTPAERERHPRPTRPAPRRRRR